MSATPASEFRTGIGARLKAGRERLGLTLLQLAEKLHVDPVVVEKLEAERFAEFDAPVYVKGHIKRYAELVGENIQELLDAYSAAIKPVLPDLTQLPKAAHHQTDPRKLVLPSLVVLIAFALVGTVWWILQNVGKLSPPVAPQAVEAQEVETREDTTTAASGTAETAPPATTSPETAGRTSEVEASAERPVAAAPNDEASTTAASTGRRGTGTRAGTTAGAASSAQITKSTQLAATPTPSPPPEPRPLKSIDVTLQFSADSWAEVYDADGQRLFYDIGAANTSHAVSGTPPLRVVLGNAPGVTVNINGRPAKVPASAVQNDSAQFTINRSGRIVRARPNEAASAASKPSGE
ncbi:MAG TPA: RodZ domain-containing protein [Steroidobacteraceae bacterium]|nr:RodZ domain-containing protein [Steroidobacteraceae bacterium]